MLYIKPDYFFEGDSVMEDTIIKALLLGYAHIECNGARP